MADKKISQLTSLAQGDIATTTDVLAIVDTSATETKKATPAAIVGAAAAAGLTNVDINSGAIDGTAIGANSAAAGTFTNLTASGTVSFSGATVSNGGSVTTVDINGGTIDGASVGANSASSGAFTTLSASGSVTLSGGTANGVLYLSGSKVATSGSALTFDGAKLIASGGNEAIRIASGAPYYSFYNAAQSTQFGYIQHTGTDLALVNVQNGAMPFYVNNAEGMRLTSTGLGIGTSSPASKLDVNGAISASGTIFRPDSGFIQWNSTGASGGTNRAIIWADSSSNLYFGTGAGNSTQATLDSSGNLCVGSTSPGNAGVINLSVGNPGTTVGGLQLWSTTSSTHYVQFGDSASGGDPYRGAVGYAHASDAMLFLTAGSERMRLDSSGNVGIGTSSPGQKLEVAGNILVNTSGNPYAEIKTSGAGNNPYLKLTADTNSWTFQGTFSNANDDLLVLYNATTLLDLDKNGNLGLGVTPSAWDAGTYALQFNGAALYGFGNGANLTQNAFYGGAWKYVANGYASYYSQYEGQHRFYNAASGTAGNAISFTQAMTLNASGNLLLGTTTASGANFDVYTSGSGNATVRVGNAQNAATLDLGKQGSSGYGATSAGDAFVYANGTMSIMSDAAAGIIKFSTGGNTERARITAAGEFLVAKTSTDVTTVGTIITTDGRVLATTGDADCMVCNRQNSDGTLMEFRHANTTEGTISVSGNTVSYNAFAGSHWSQLQDGSKPDILRGTVMESINELCVWPGEQNERLPKSKISDTAGSKKVYGVFMAWDNDWTETNDMYVTAVGAFICRVNGSATVQEGDLLESNGDGTARVQADDIIRSSTIGKVTSTVKTHQYDDGSYCVPTVLYCG